MELVTQYIEFNSFLEESQVISIQNYVCYFYSVFKCVLAQLQRSIAVTVYWNSFFGMPLILEEYMPKLKIT